MKRRDGVHRCAAVMLIAVFALVRVCAAQDETQTPREAVEEKQPTTIPTFTIYPVPDYGGDFRSRSYLTGDWGGLRSKLADRGVQFEFNITQIFQGVASGATNRTGKYSGLTDMVIDVCLEAGTHRLCCGRIAPRAPFRTQLRNPGLEWRPLQSLLLEALQR